VSRLDLDIWGYGAQGKLDIRDEALVESPAIEFMPKADKELLIKLIHEIFDNNELNHYDPLMLDDVTHELVLPVTVPQVDVIHSVELVLPDEDHYVIGKTIHTQLMIKSHQDWAPTALSPDTEFSYDLMETHDTWAISGKRKSLFKLSKQLTTEQPPIEFAMIPLRSGKLPLPRIEIAAVGDRRLTMEVDFRNGSETALVVPEFDRLTVTF
jgi:hypothetical protein